MYRWVVAQRNHAPFAASPQDHLEHAAPAIASMQDTPLKNRLLDAPSLVQPCFEPPELVGQFSYFDHTGLPCHTYSMCFRARVERHERSHGGHTAAAGSEYAAQIKRG